MGYLISVAAHYEGENVNTATLTKAITALLKTEEPIVSGVITAADKAVSGRAPSGASIVLTKNANSKKDVHWFAVFLFFNFISFK
ncbi:MAG: hypothetical protein Q8930_17100 [Bacillota bacterium]|nr:hypothetical protein [Bacillota bacterium]